MSDGYTDAMNDIEYGYAFDHYWEAVAAYLESPAQDTLAKIYEQADTADKFSRFHRYSDELLRDTTEKTLDLLQKGEPHFWLKVLVDLERNISLFKRLKECSPFKGKALFFYYSDGAFRCPEMKKEFLPYPIVALQLPIEQIKDLVVREPSYLRCDTCKRKLQTAKKREDKGLSAGTHCDKCWSKLVTDCRSRSW